MKTLGLWVKARRYWLLGAISVTLIFVSPGLLKGLQEANDPIIGLKVTDVEKIELWSFHDNDDPQSNNTKDVKEPRVITDRREIAAILRVLQKAKDSWKAPEVLAANAPDEIRVFSKNHISSGSFTIYMDVSHVEQEYGPEMKKLHERLFPGTARFLRGWK